MQPVQYNWQPTLQLFSGNFPINASPPPIPNPGNLNPAPTYPPNQVAGIPLTNPVQTTYTYNPLTGTNLTSTLPSNSTSTTVRSYIITLDFNATVATSFSVTGIDFMGASRSEVVEIDVGGRTGVTALQYISLISIIPLTTNNNQTVISVVSSVEGMTQPFICDVFNKFSTYAISINFGNTTTGVSITPVYTLASFSGFNNLTNPSLNTNAGSIIWLNFPTTIFPVIDPNVASFSDYIPNFPMTAFALQVVASSSSNLEFTAQIMQQGAFF